MQKPTSDREARSPTASGTGRASATSRPAISAQASTTSFISAGTTPSVITPSPASSPAMKDSAAIRVQAACWPISRPSASTASRCAGTNSGCSRPPENPPMPSGGGCASAGSAVSTRPSAASGEPRRHASRTRNTTPASAITPPAARTAIRPAGQRASRPNAMPARCSRPVAMTKPR